MESNNNLIMTIKELEDAKAEDEEFARILNNNYQDILKTEDCVLDALNGILNNNK